MNNLCCHGMRTARSVGYQIVLLLLLVIVVIISIPFQVPFIAWQAWKDEA